MHEDLWICPGDDGFEWCFQFLESINFQGSSLKSIPWIYSLSRILSCSWPCILMSRSSHNSRRIRNATRQRLLRHPLRSGSTNFDPQNTIASEFKGRGGIAAQQSAVSILVPLQWLYRRTPRKAPYSGTFLSSSDTVSRGLHPAMLNGWIRCPAPPLESEQYLYPLGVTTERKCNNRSKRSSWIQKL